MSHFVVNDDLIFHCISLYKRSTVWSIYRVQGNPGIQCRRGFPSLMASAPPASIKTFLELALDARLTLALRGNHIARAVRLPGQISG